jgi:hypothetical protein
MPLPQPLFPVEDGSFAAIPFWELSPDGRYAAYAPEHERTIIGQTVITRYTRPVEATIQVLCGLDEADDLEAAVGTSGTLNWHRSNATALLVRAEVKRVSRIAVAEASLTFII